MALLTDAGHKPVSSGTEARTNAHCAGSHYPADGSSGHLENRQHATSAVFLHSSWRTSHTWFWLKFREHSSAICFYEPFHEGLATVTRSEALSAGPASWDSRHPDAEPYLLEYLPLLRKNGGVRLFVPEISYRWFLPVGGPLGDLRPTEMKYLALLIRRARRLGRLPVFGFTRSLGRVAAIKKQFPGIHIFQHRNLWTQWMSWFDHKQNSNNYFLRRFLQIMMETEDIYLSTVLNRYLARDVQCVTDHSTETLSAELVGSLSEQDLFSLYMAFHTYIYLCAAKTADLVVDITKMARDMTYRNQICSWLVCATGLPIVLDDVSEIQRYHSFDPGLIDWTRIRENLNFAILMLDHLFDGEELLRYGTVLLDETLAEIKISERYVAGARHQTTTLTAERDSAVAAKSSLAAERNQLAAERDALLAEHARLSAQHEAAAVELQQLARELAAGNTLREHLIAENAHLRSDVARTVATVTQQASDLAALRLEQTALRTELSCAEAVRAETAAQSEKWFEAAIVWPSERDLHPHPLQRDQWLQRHKVWLSACLTGGWSARAHPRRRTRTRADRARDIRQWELAARFYADELNRNSGDAAIWVQFGHVLKAAARLSEAEIAYREALILDGRSIDALASLGHVLSLQGRQVEAGEIYTRTLDLEIPSPLRSAIVKELVALCSRSEAIPHMAEDSD